jgi:hypothetical protein
VAIQSLLKAGFFSAVQVELVFMIGGLHTVTKATRSEGFRNFAPKRDFDPCYQQKTRTNMLVAVQRSRTMGGLALRMRPGRTLNKIPMQVLSGLCLQ